MKNEEHTAEPESIKQTIERVVYAIELISDNLVLIHKRVKELEKIIYDDKQPTTK